MTRSSLSPRRAARCAALLLASSLSAAVFAGCGSVGNTASARLRSVDAATNAGTADLLVNGSASYGDQTYFATSSYFYVSTGSSTFTAAANTSNGNIGTITARSTSYNLSVGQFYTAYLVGRGDVTVTTDNRDLEVLVANDSKPPLNSGQAAIRVIDAAPDAGAVDVLVNGSTPDPSFSGLAFPVAKDNILTGNYIPVNAGTLSVQVNAASASTAIIPAKSVPVQAGHAYTLLVTEPTAGAAGGAAPTYALQTTAE